MITRFKSHLDTPYSLHDMLVDKIHALNNNLYLNFTFRSYSNYNR